MKRLSTVLVLFLVGCSPVYVPNMRNATLFEKKGDFKATAYLVRSAEVQTAYALSNHFAVMANGAITWDPKPPYFRYGELGAGYFTKVNQLNLEFFGGYGIGTTSSYFDQNVIGDFYKVYTTLAIGQREEQIEWSFINRLSLVDFVTYPTDPQRSATFYLEPAGYFGYSIVKDRFFGAAQFGVCYPLRRTAYFDYEPFSISLGFTYRFGKRTQ
jgi:hypothetical protein